MKTRRFFVCKYCWAKGGLSTVYVIRKGNVGMSLLVDSMETVGII